jgi:hypothetical protein
LRFCTTTSIDLVLYEQYPLSFDANYGRNLKGIVPFAEQKTRNSDGCRFAEARRRASIFHETATALEHKKRTARRSLADYNGVCDAIAEALFLIGRPDKNCPY